MYIDFSRIYVYHSKAEARCGLCPGRDGCPQGVTWAWQDRWSVLIQQKSSVFHPWRRSKAPTWLYSSAMLPDILLVHGFEVTSLDAFCAAVAACAILSNLLWPSAEGSATQVLQRFLRIWRIRPSGYEKRCGHVEGCHFKHCCWWTDRTAGLLCSDSAQVDALPEKGRVSWERKLNRLEEDVWQTQSNGKTLAKSQRLSLKFIKRTK